MRDYRSLETKIRLIKEGRLTTDGWELIGENKWYHPAGDVVRTIDPDGNIRITNAAGDDVSVGIAQAKDLNRKMQIKTKIIDEAFPDKKDKKDPKAKTPPKEEKDPANDKEDESGTSKVNAPSKNTDLETSDRKDPKEIKGGKTQVDLEPTTDDKIGNDSDAKKKAVKEDTDNRKHKWRVHYYSRGTGKNKSKTLHTDHDDEDKVRAHVQKTHGPTTRITGVEYKGHHIVKEDVLDELSFETHKAYLDKAHNDPQRRQGVHMAAYKRMKHIVKTEPSTTKRGKEQQTRMLARQHKHATSAPMKKPGTTHANEEAITEVSRGKLNSYLDAGAKDAAKVAKKPAGQRRTSAEKTRYDKRSKGAEVAFNKLTGRAKVNATEELFTADELAYFDRIMSEEYVDMSKKNVDAVINAKGKPHKVYTATDETRHGISVDELKRHLGISDSEGVHKKFMHNLHTAGVRTGWSHSSGKWIAYHGKKV